MATTIRYRSPVDAIETATSALMRYGYVSAADGAYCALAWAAIGAASAEDVRHYLGRLWVARIVREVEGATVVASTYGKAVILGDRDGLDIRICAECGEIHLAEEGDGTADDWTSVGADDCCPDCVDDTTVCEYSEEIVWCEDASTVNVRRNGRIVEQTWGDDAVSNHASRCADCDEYFCDATMPLSGPGDDICASCLENYTTCDACGDWHRCEDSYSDDDGDGSYCSQRCQPDVGGIHSYGSHYSVRLRGTPRFSAEPHLGLEIEICAARRTSSQIAASAREDLGSVLADCQKDSSIGDGVEVITQPLTIAEWRKVWASVDPRKWGGKAHDTDCCGLHVHVSRNVVTESVWLRFATLFAGDVDVDAWSDLMRRHPGQYRQACVKKGRYVDNKQGRYHTVNLTNDRTVELRWPRGTTNPQTLLATAELAWAGLQYARLQPGELAYSQFVRWVHRDPWARSETSALRRYMTTRQAPGAEPLRTNPTTTPTTIGAE